MAESKEHVKAIRAEIVRFQGENSYLPAISADFGSDYQGWFAEAFKRLRVRSLRATEDERIKLYRKREELLRLHDSIIQTLDTIAVRPLQREKTELLLKYEMDQVRQDIDLQPLAKEKRELEFKVEIAQLKGKLKATENPLPSPPPPDPHGEEKKRRDAIYREEKVYQEEMEEEIRKHPDHEKQLRWTYRKRIEELWKKP